MLLLVGQSQPISAAGGTYGGVLVNVMLLASASNTQILPSDFLPSNVTLQGSLTRGGKQYQLFNDNLNVLGTYWSLRGNLYRFTNGWNLTPPSAGVFNTMQRSVYIEFGSNITLQAGDKLVVQMNFGANAISANISNSGQTFIDFQLSPAIGKSAGIPTTIAEVVQQNITNQNFINTSGVQRIEFLNFDQSTFASLVVSNVAVASDKLSYSVPWYVAYGDAQRKWPANIPYLFGTALSTAGTSVVRGLDQLPQCIPLYTKGKMRAGLNSCGVSITFNTANVNASQNYVVYTSCQKAS